MTANVRVRFAPSPTGHLHIGGARTAIYNWAFARHHGGTFVLRIEDTDPERSTPENTQAILRAMRFLGLDYDEGPGIEGPYEPYFQTQRAALHAEGLASLKANGHVYPCFCAADALEVKREAARAKGGFAGYDRTCRLLPSDEALARVDSGEAHVWRLKVPDDRGDVTFNDAVRGETSFAAENIEDFVLARADGSATYNFAVVMDDADMAITHVIRGDDHLSNTPKQILLYEALGRTVPVFAHLSMIWGPDGKRLSKRHGATSVEAYAEDGFLPEALVNYLALLGWSLDGETTVIDRQTLVGNFTLERISRNPAIFDAEKLEWLNGVYMRSMPADEFVERMTPLLIEAGLATADELASRKEWLLALCPLVAERAKRLTDIVPIVRFLFEDVSIEESARTKVLGVPGSREVLAAASQALTACAWNATDIETALREVPERVEAKPKIVFQAVRVAISGSTVSPPLFESLELLGRDAALSRLSVAAGLAQ